MELTQLRYFRALAENGSLCKTAEKLYITPPALSASLSRLERELGTTLFDRSKSLVLNERGKIFLSHITQALDEIDIAKTALYAASDLQQTQLTVGVASVVVWNNLFLDFLRTNPHITLNQKQVLLDDMSNEYILINLDFVIAAPEDLSTEALHSILLYNDDRPMLMVSAHHPLARAKGVPLADVKDEGFIALSSGTSSRRYFDLLFSIAGIQPRIVAECSPQMRRVFIAEGLGIGLGTAHTMVQNRDPGICFVEITNPVYQRSQALYWHAKRYQTQAAQAFRNFAADYFKGGFPEEKEY